MHNEWMLKCTVSIYAMHAAVVEISIEWLRAKEKKRLYIRRLSMPHMYKYYNEKE